MLYWQFVLSYIVVSKSIIVKRLKWVMMINIAIWVHVLWCLSCAICVLFFKVELVLLMSNSTKWLLSFKEHPSICAGVVMSGLILSFTTDIMYISMFPGFWKWIPMIHMHELLMHLLFMSTLCPCRYLLYMQAMVFARSCGLFGSVITSVDGCCLYIIVHNRSLHDACV